MEMMMPATDQRPTRDPAGLYPPAPPPCPQTGLPPNYSHPPNLLLLLLCFLIPVQSHHLVLLSFIHMGTVVGILRDLGLGLGGWAGLRYCVPVYLG